MKCIILLYMEHQLKTTIIEILTVDWVDLDEILGIDEANRTSPIMMTIAGAIAYYIFEML